MLPTILQPLLVNATAFGSLVFGAGAIVFVSLHSFRKHVAHPKGRYRQGKINIWLAELQGDSTTNRERTALSAALREILGNSVEILRADVKPVLEETPDVGAEAEKGNARARQYLEENGGELLLWGEYVKKGQPHLYLRLVSAVHDGSKAAHIGSDSETETWLHAQLSSFISDALIAVIAALREDIPGNEEEAEPLLRTLAPKLRPLAETRTRGYPEELRAEAFFCLGSTLCKLASIDDSIPVFRESVRELLRSRRCWRFSRCKQRKIAECMMLLSEDYMHLGHRCEKQWYLHATIHASRVATRTITAEGNLEDWARCKKSEAWGLYELGYRNDSRQFLEEGASVCDEFLRREDTRKLGYRRLGLLNSLGAIRSSLGRQEQSAQILQQAVETYRELEKESQEWHVHCALAQSNVAVTCLYCWDLDQRKEHLEEAWSACERSLKVYSPDFEPAHYGNVKCMMGDVLANQRQWINAAEYYLEALKFLTPETNEVAWKRAREMLRCVQNEARGGDLVVTLPAR